MMLFTVCYECVHFKNLEPRSPREHVWYNHVCTATPLPVQRDPVTGQLQNVSRNDLGREIFTDQPFQFCREINKGNCPLFEKKGRLEQVTTNG